MIFSFTFFKKLIPFFAVLICSCHKQSSKKILFSDNFETYSNNEDNIGDWKLEGNVTVNSEKAFSGNQSLKFISDEGYKNRAFANFSSIFPVKNNAFYGSMMLYLKEASPNGVHWTMIQSSGKIKNTDYSAEIRYGGQHRKKLMANYDTKGIKSDCWQHSDFKIPEGKWTKYKWYFNGSTNTMKLWVNDSLIDKLTVINKGSGCVENEMDNMWIFPEFDKLSIGWVDYQKGGGQREFWIDDISFWTE